MMKKKVYFRPLFFDVSFRNDDPEYINLQTAFTKAKETRNLILDNFNLILLCPTTSLPFPAIVQATTTQNYWCNDSVVSIFCSLLDIDQPLDLKRGEEGEQQTIRKLLREQFIPTQDGSSLDFPMKQVESETIHKKVHTNAVQTFLRTADSKLKSLFTQNDLIAIWSGNI